MRLNRRRISLVPVCGVLLSVHVAGCGSSSARLRDVDPQALNVLKEMSDTLSHASTMTMRVRATVDRPVATGQLAQFHRTSLISMARPDRLHIRTESDEGHWAACSRDGTFNLLDSDANLYATESVPRRIQKQLDHLAETYGLVMPTADLLVDSPYDSLTANVQSGEYVGRSTCQAVECHHLLFRQAEIDWQIWVDAGALRVPCKLVITQKDEPDQPQYEALFDQWNFAPVIAGDTFAFTPPAGASATSMQDLLADTEGDLP